MILTKVTLIWVSKPEKPFKIISIPKRLIYLLIGGCCLLFLISLLLFSLTRGFVERQLAIQQENQSLKNTIAQKKQLYQAQHSRSASLIREQTVVLSEKEKSLESLRLEMSGVLVELEKIRSNEVKIRHFLGLDAKGLEAKHPNQGGTSFDRHALASLENPVAPGHIHESLGIDPITYSKSLKSSVQELLDYIEQKQSEARKLPTILPAVGNQLWISSKFGWRSNPYTGRGREFHAGLDIAGPWKSPIIASADGEVIEVAQDRFLGNSVRVLHKKDLISIYGHLNSVAVSKGDKVERGDVLGYMGNTGRSTGVHLHYSIMKDDKYVDPLDYVWDLNIPPVLASASSD